VSHGSFIYGFGGRVLSVVEPQKFIITKGYPIRFYKVKTDFALLAKKRWVSGESVKALATYFEISETTIKRYLKESLERFKLGSLNLSERDKEAIEQGIGKEQECRVC
jgi:predicted transcriptional regulator